MNTVELLHEENESFVFMSASRLEDEINLFLNALEQYGQVHPLDDEAVFGRLSADLLAVLPSMFPIDASTIPTYFQPLSEVDCCYLKQRCLQVLKSVRNLAKKSPHSIYAVSPAMNRRWSDLIAGRLLPAQIAVCYVGSL
jgi:hypothetical protein